MDSQIPELEIQLLECDPFSPEDLLDLRPFDYDGITLISRSVTPGSSESVDSQTILTLLHLQQIFRGRPEGSSTKLIAELLDSENRELISHQGVREFIISNQLISSIIAQVSEQAHMSVVYSRLLKGAGSEFYLKPVDLYFSDPPAAATFADYMAAATARGEVAIGYKRLSLEHDSEANFGVRLIPPKNEVVGLRAEDALVVLAPDET